VKNADARLLLLIRRDLKTSHRDLTALNLCSISEIFRPADFVRKRTDKAATKLYLFILTNTIAFE